MAFLPVLVVLRRISGDSKDKMKESNTLKKIPDKERPYEKCMEAGASALSDAELLAVLLRTGSRGENVIELAMRILYQSGGNGLLDLHHF